MHVLLNMVQPELKDIVDEIRSLRDKIDRLEDLVQKRLIGEAEPDEYEKEAIKDFESKKKDEQLEFSTLNL